MSGRAFLFGVVVTGLAVATAAGESVVRSPDGRNELRLCVGETLSYSVWYVGAMTDWTARTLNLDTSFLDDGVWRAEIFADGVNADREATDYVRRTATVRADEGLHVVLQPGGGFAARLERVP